MAYFLLAVGALMAVAGAYAAVTGYSIVQVEVGWSSFIVGATLFAGGIVTIALGLVLRTLLQIQAGLVPTRKATARGAAEPTAVAKREEPEAPPVALPPKRAPSPSDASSLAEGFGSANEPGPDPAPDGYKLETPSTPEHDLVTADRGAPSEQAAPQRAAVEEAAVKEVAVNEPATRPPQRADDWLDRAFADLDRDVLAGETWDRGSHGIHAAPASRSSGRPADMPPAQDPSGGRPSPQAPVEAAPAVTAANYTSAVIGRYEADGTSYIMYADGSIEAQTTSGVYRFASMAELKAFIES